MPIHTPVVVSGSVPGEQGRVVQLQHRTPTGWSTAASTRASLGGLFTLAAPTHYTHPAQTVRVVAPATGDDPAAISASTGWLAVSPPYVGRGSASSYRLLGSHSRWDPCRVITYRVNPRLAPVGGATDVHRAFRMVSEASGLRFRYLGRTTHVPRRGGSTEFDTTADVSVAWARPTTVPVLAGSTIGYGGSRWQSTGGPWNRITHGYVVLDATWRGGVAGFPLRKVQSRGQLLLHEIGHVVGLDHVKDSSQTLHATLQRAPARYGAGDLAGLAQVGAGQGCL